MSNILHSIAFFLGFIYGTLRNICILTVLLPLCVPVVIYRKITKGA